MGWVSQVFPPLNLTLGHILSKLQLGQAEMGHVGTAAGHGFASVSFSLHRHLRQLRWVSLDTFFLLLKASSEKKSDRSTW